MTGRLGEAADAHYARVQLLQWRPSVPARWRRQGTCEFYQGTWQKYVRITLQVVTGAVGVVVGAFLEPAWKAGWTVFSWAIVGVVLGVLIPLLISEKWLDPQQANKEKLESFADHLPEAIDCIKEFIDSKMQASDVTVMHKNLTKAAASMVSTSGVNARVCLWNLDRREISEADQSDYEHRNRYLTYIWAAGRSDNSRGDFQPNTRHGRAHISAAMKGQQIPVHNVHKAPPELDVEVVPGQRYGSFILTPVWCDGEPHGTVTIDLPGSSKFTQIDSAISGAIGRLFEIGFSVVKRREDFSEDARSELLSKLSRIRLQVEEG